jgi:hypothetical protein
MYVCNVCMYVCMYVRINVYVLQSVDLVFRVDVIVAGFVLVFGRLWGPVMYVCMYVRVYAGFLFSFLGVFGIL